jgi:hypothetical protein
VAEIPAKKFKRARGEKFSGRIRVQILAEFYLKWQKKGRRKFSTEVAYFTVMANTQRQRQNLIFISKNWPFGLNAAFFVSVKKLAELFWCTGQKTSLGPGNTAEEGEHQKIWFDSN